MFNEIVVFGMHSEELADFVIIFHQRQLVYAHLIIDVFLLRILYRGIQLFEGAVYLNTDHHGTPVDVAIVIDVWNESMQMSFLSVHLTVFIELSRRENVSQCHRFYLHSVILEGHNHLLALNDLHILLPIREPNLKPC